jgi:bacteriocin biosynthesis cyclodehydratase domain-containing protein
MLAPDMRPEFKAETYYAPVHDGVYLRGNKHHLMLKGKSLYPLLERLIPHLNGQTTLEDLTSGLDAGRKHMVMQLIEKLLAHQFLRVSRSHDAAMLPPPVLPGDTANLAFVGSFHSSAAPRLEAFHQKHVLLIGDTSACSSLVQACLHSGVRQISALVTPGEEMLPHMLARLAEEATRCASPAQVVRWLQFSDLPKMDELRTSLQACDAVLHLASCQALVRARLLNKLCFEEQKPCMQALLVGTEAWIGPLVHPDGEGCWECAWLRWQANQASDPTSAVAERLPEQQSPTCEQLFMDLSTRTMVTQRLIFALFRFFTGLASPETANSVCMVHLPTGLSEQHAFLPHPLCQTCQHPLPPTAAGLLAQVQDLQRHAPIERNTLLESLPVGLVDDRLGVLKTLAGDAFVQVPLAISQISLAHPVRLRSHAYSLTLTVAGRDTADARWRAFQQAFLHYAVRLVDDRRLFSLNAEQQREYKAIPAGHLLNAHESDREASQWIWALDLHTQQARPVPAAQVFSEDEQTIPCELAPGISAGASWAEALAYALLSWCNYLTLQEMMVAHEPFARVDLNRMRLTPAGIYDAHLLQIATEEMVAVYDITGSLQVPTFVTCLGDRTVACTSHCDASRAIGLGLERALLQRQAVLCQQYAYAPAPVPDLPLSLRSTQWSVPSSTLPHTWPDRTAWLLQRLQFAGLEALAIPLNHDPALARVFPFLVRVLVASQSQRSV